MTISWSTNSSKSPVWTSGKFARFRNLDQPATANGDRFPARPSFDLPVDKAEIPEGRTLPRRWLRIPHCHGHPNQRLFARWCLYKGLEVCSLQTCAGTKARASGETKRECALTNFSSTEAASPLVCRCKPSSVLPMVRRWRNPKALHLIKQRSAL